MSTLDEVNASLHVFDVDQQRMERALRSLAQNQPLVDRALADFQRTVAQLQPDFQRTIARLQPELFRLLDMPRMQQALDRVNAASRAAMEYDASRSVALAMPALPPPLPTVEDSENAALREKNEELTRQLLDARLALLFGGPEYEVSPDDFDSN